ncbi:MAG: hypothetical protein WD077_02875 [Bacteroidia bacterium]
MAEIPSDFSIQHLAPQHIDDLLKIAEEQLGSGYLNPHFLKSHLDDDNLIALVALVGDEVAGFSLMELCSVDDLAKKVEVERSWLDINFVNFDPIGYRKITAVKKSLSGRGIGSLLVAAGMAELQKHSKAVVSVAWKSSDGGVHIGKLAQKHDWIPMREIAHYWREDSIKNQYSCSSCGQPPCTCSAVVYAKFYN